MYHHQLDTFLQAARSGSFSQAAKRLYISQSAVTQQINSLEERLQIRLFCRTKHGVKLTPAGEYLMQEADAFIEHSRRLIRGMRELNETQGSIRLGSSMENKIRLLLDLWLLYQEKHPEQDIRIEHLDTERGLVEADLVEGLKTEAAWEMDFDFTQIFAVPLQFGLSRRHPLAGKQELTLPQIRPYTVNVLDREHPDHVRRAHDQLKRGGVRLRMIAQFNNSEVLDCLLKNELLIAPVCWRDILPDLVFRSGPMAVSMPYGVFSRRNASEGVQAFLRFIRDVYAGRAETEVIPVFE